MTDFLESKQLLDQWREQRNAVALLLTETEYNEQIEQLKKAIQTKTQIDNSTDIMGATAALANMINDRAGQPTIKGLKYVAAGYDLFVETNLKK